MIKLLYFIHVYILETQHWLSFKVMQILKIKCTWLFPFSQTDVRSLCKKTSLPESKVHIWFRRRRNQERPGLRKRFCEARCVFECVWRDTAVLFTSLCASLSMIFLFYVCQQLEMCLLFFCIHLRSHSSPWCKCFFYYDMNFYYNRIQCLCWTFFHCISCLLCCRGIFLLPYFVPLPLPPHKDVLLRFHCVQSVL